MPRHKSEYQIGMETILNNKETSFLKNPQVFNAIVSESKMPISQIIRHLGKNKKLEPSDKEKSEQRLQNLEAKINK
jgi:hypothetical protein